MIRDPEGTVPGTLMPRVAMPDDWVVLLADYLSGTRGPPRDAAGPAFSDIDPKPASRSPAQLYALRCAACHGTEGRGDGPNAENLPVRPTPHADAQVMSLRPDDSLYDAIAGGGWIMGKNARMPPFGETLAPDDIRGLVRYIRTLCECEGPAWSRDGARSREDR